MSGDGRRFAFRVSDARPGAKSGSAAVFVLAAGARRARMIYRHRLGRLGCAAGADMRWQGEHLLYSSADGDLAILRPRPRMRLDLARVARALPRRWDEERANAAWAAGRAVDGHPGRRGR